MPIARTTAAGFEGLAMYLDSQEKKDACVLVVDDSATNRTLLRTILKASGYEVEEAADGGQCIEHCRRAPPSIVLLDVMMPNVDGLTACRELRQAHSKADLPIIMVTTMAEEEGLAQSLAAGANDYVTKPIDRVTLMARLENQIALSQAQHRLTEKSRALEKALRIHNATGDVLPEAILVHDKNGIIVYRNQTCVEFCGGAFPTSMSELCDSIFAGKFRDVLSRWYQGAKDASAPEESRELLHSDSPYHSVYSLTKPIRIDDGVLRLWLWRDDTAKRNLERSVNQRVKLETVGMFAAGVAHNFNNIMAAVLGATEVLERHTQAGGQGQRCLSLIKKAVASGTSLTRKMSSAYGKHLPSVATDNNGLETLIYNIVECYEQTCKGRIFFEQSFPPELPRVIVPGPVLLEILGNVISNAVESISESGRIKISGQSNANRSKVEICIEDTGIGMSQEELARVYEPFYSTKKFDKLSGVSVEGRGLGMWNTYNLVHSYQGSLTVESAVGKGTSVSIRLPAISSAPTL